MFVLFVSAFLKKKCCALLLEDKLKSIEQSDKGVTDKQLIGKLDNQ